MLGDAMSQLEFLIFIFNCFNGDSCQLGAIQGDH